MTTATLESILTQHAIPLADWPELRALVFNGTRPSKGVLRRLCRVAKYRRAIDSILTELSKQVRHVFPPR